MRVVALVSGGKDSCFNMMQCVAAGHEIVALANLRPADTDEIDSYMYQTVGHDGIDLYSESLGLPLFRRVISGNAVVQDKEYSPTSGDEVEDLFCLLDDIKKEIDFEGVSVGAILSDYQRIRVENVCTRLGCVSLAYLWRRDQGELLQEMIDCGINAIIIKTASLGLDPNVHLGQTIAEMQAHLVESKGKYGINICGEGGEYETFTLDCPLFKQSIILDDYEKVIHSNDAFAPVGYLKLKQMHLVKKSVSRTESEEVPVDQEPHLPVENLEDVPKSRKPTKPVKRPLDYVSDLIECTKADCCDGHIELCQGNAENNQCGDANIAETEHKHHEFCGGECGKLKIKDKSSEQNNKGESTDSMSPVVEPCIDCGDVTPDTCQTRELVPFPSSLRVTMNPGGWMWVMGIDGKDSNAEESPDVIHNPMQSVLQCLQGILEGKGLKLSDLVAICMYVASLEEYSQYNKEYIKFFTESRPPVRVCVEAPLPSDTPILVEAIAYKQQGENDGNNTRQCMHVQGISHWAPANIGPYSQAISIGDIIYVAGQIGLVPGSMELVKGGAKMECKLALRSLNRILKAIDSKVELRDVVQSICFVTNAKYIDDCRQAWEKLTTNAIVEYLVVSKLPRNARVEWQIWAHKHNTAFEYEETGCYVGSGVKVRIIRRWNYENRVSAIVCRASITKEDVVFGLQELMETVEYALTKLLREAEKSLECSVRVFYRIGSLNPSEAVKVLEDQFSKYAIAFSVVPVQSLVMDQTVLSLCGVRH